MKYLMVSLSTLSDIATAPGACAYDRKQIRSGAFVQEHGPNGLPYYVAVTDDRC